MRNREVPKRRSHIVTVLLHDYFHRGVFKQVIGEKQWSRFESRLGKNVEDALNLFKEHNIKATFFALGWIADSCPEIIARIASEGHEIASAGYWARSVHEMTEDQFREDIERTKHALEAAGSNRIIGYRCAYRWLRNADSWVFDILAEEGYLYDASLRPPSCNLWAKDYRRFVHEIQTRNGKIWEFPTSTSSILGFRFAIAGGNYLRQFPHFLMLRSFKKWCKDIEKPFIMYFHPWELDTKLPVISALGPLSTIRQYRNLGKMSLILPEYFREGHFQSISQYLNVPLDYPACHEVTSTDEVTVSEISIKGKPAISGHRSKKEVSIVVPCFNEVSSLPYLERALAEMLTEANGIYDLKFIFVDDCSTDETCAILENLFGNRKDTKIIRHDVNKGVASAIRTGLIAADTELVCSMDADCSYDPPELLKMVSFIEDGVDMVTASPYHPGGFVLGVPRWRLFLSKSLSNIYHVLLRHKLSTYTSCFRVYRRSGILDIPIKYGDFRGIVELLAKLDIRGGTIREFPTTLQCRIFGYSKMKILSTIVGHLKLLLEVKKYQKDFACRRPKSN